MSVSVCVISATNLGIWSAIVLRVLPPLFVLHATNRVIWRRIAILGGVSLSRARVRDNVHRPDLIGANEAKFRQHLDQFRQSRGFRLSKWGLVGVRPYFLPLHNKMLRHLTRQLRVPYLSSLWVNMCYLIMD